MLKPTKTGLAALLALTMIAPAQASVSGLFGFRATASWLRNLKITGLPGKFPKGRSMEAQLAALKGVAYNGSATSRIKLADLEKIATDRTAANTDSPNELQFILKKGEGSDVHTKAGTQWFEGWAKDIIGAFSQEYNKEAKADGSVIDYLTGETSKKELEYKAESKFRHRLGLALEAGIAKSMGVVDLGVLVQLGISANKFTLEGMNAELRQRFFADLLLTLAYKWVEVRFGFGVVRQNIKHSLTDEDSKLANTFVATAKDAAASADELLKTDKTYVKLAGVTARTKMTDYIKDETLTDELKAVAALSKLEVPANVDISRWSPRVLGYFFLKLPIMGEKLKALVGVGYAHPVGSGEFTKDKVKIKAKKGGEWTANLGLQWKI